MKFIETSAKTAQNVEDSFVLMTKEIIAQVVEKEKSVVKKDTNNREKVDLNKPQQRLEVEKKYIQE